MREFSDLFSLAFKAPKSFESVEFKNSNQSFLKVFVLNFRKNESDHFFHPHQRCRGSCTRRQMF